MCTKLIQKAKTPDESVGTLCQTHFLNTLNSLKEHLVFVFRLDMKYNKHTRTRYELKKKRTLQFCTGGNVNRTEVCNNAFAASNSKRFFVLVPAALPQAVLKFLLGLTPPLFRLDRQHLTKIVDQTMPSMNREQN